MIQDVIHIIEIFNQHVGNQDGHGWLNVTSAIQHSCNYFFYETGRRIGIDNLAKYTRHFGLGKKTGIELLGEASGRLNERTEGQTWNPGNTIQAAIGQLDNQYTPIQIAKYTSMLANGGNKVKPTLIKSIKKVDGTEVEKQEYENYFNEKLGIVNEENDGITINPDNLKTVLEGMRDVTSESGGTAYKYFKNFNITVGGKTGSAQVEVGGKIAYAHAWFVGFAPFDNPEIAVVILVERGGSRRVYCRSCKRCNGRILWNECKSSSRRHECQTIYGNAKLDKSKSRNKK